MLPTLINPVQVSIDVLDQAQMLMDSQAREPVHGVRSATGDSFVIPAQIKVDQFKAPTAEPGGVITASIGYILVRVYDMDVIMGVGKRLKRGDHISGWTSRVPGGEVTSCDLYITRVDPCGHYPDRGATMYKCHFEDRDPVQ